MEEEKNMSFLQHLEELRWRLVRCAAVIIVLAVVIWWNQDWIMRHVFLSMSKADFFTFDFFCRYLNFMCVEEIPINFQSTTMGGQFSYALWMSFLGGIVVGFPFIFYQIWSFVKPGLKQNEKKMVKGIVFYVSLLFFAGILFGYFKTGIFESLNSRRQAVMDKGIHMARLFGRNIFFDIEIFHLAGEMYAQRSMVKLRDGSYA